MDKIQTFLNEEMLEKEKIDCIGVSLKNDRISELKGYHYSQHKIDRNGLTSFCETKGINARKHCKIKSNSVEELVALIDVFAEEYKVPTEKWSLQSIKDLAILVQNVAQSPKILLNHVGIKINDNEIEQLKLYMTLRRFEEANDIKGFYQGFNNSKNIINCVCNNLNVDNKYIQILKKYSEICEPLMYFPSLLGVNIGHHTSQVKTYFELFETNYELENLRRKKRCLFESMKDIRNESNLEKIEEVVDVFMKNGFFLRGFGISDDEVLRLYFSLYERFVV